MTLSWLYLRASTIRDGSMMPPRRRRTRCSVDSASNGRQRGKAERPRTVRMDASLTLLDVVVCQRAPVLQLLAGEDQALLVRRDA